MNQRIRMGTEQGCLVELHVDWMDGIRRLMIVEEVRAEVSASVMMC
jgi:hypothetical protein